MRIHPALASLMLAFFSTFASGQSTWVLKPIDNLDVSRYLGRWYEIAKFPNRFQQQCVSDTSADYAVRPDGNLSVLNQCRLADGQWERAIGLAKRVREGSSAQLQVRFAPAWLSFLPWVWGDYWVVDLDERYELAAVSEPGRQYLWILSRTPVVDNERYSALLSRLVQMGLDVNKLEKSAQMLAIRQP